MQHSLLTKDVCPCTVLRRVIGFAVLNKSLWRIVLYYTFYLYSMLYNNVNP